KDMDISENEFDDVLDHVLDATDGIGQEWEALNDGILQEGTSETKRTKTYYLPLGEYAQWIKTLEKSRP
ncbi:13309_t:CDS:1, partial [Funneliformis geosporum]